MKSGNIIKNFLYNTAYQLMIIIIPLITTPYLSRVLGAEKLGIYSFNYSVAYYFSIFIILGLNNYGNRKIAACKNNKIELSKQFWSIYCMQFSCGLIVLLAYILYLGVFTDFSVIGLVFALYIVSEILNINWLFFGLEVFKITVSRSAVIKVFSTVAIFFFVHDKEDLIYYCAIVSFSALLNQAVLWTYAPRYIKKYSVSVKDITVHIVPNLVLFLSVIGTSLYKYMDKIMLGKICNMTELGYYEQAEKIVALPVALIVSLGTVMLPRMSFLRANANDNEGGFRSYYGLSMLFAIFVSSSMAFGIMGVSKEFVPLFYGIGYDTVVVLFYILLPSCVFLGIGNVITTQYLIPTSQDKVYVKSIFLGAAVNFFMNLFLIPRYQACGAALGTFFAEAAVCAYKIIKSNNEMKTIRFIKISLPFIAIGMFMFFMLISIHFQGFSVLAVLAIKVLLGGLLFLMISFVYYRLFLYKKIEWRKKDEARNE